VTSRRDHDWLARFIVSPQKVRESGDPIALALRAKYKSVIMPNLDLMGDDAKVLIEYIERESGKAGSTAGTTGAAASTGFSVKPMLDPYLRMQTALNVDNLADAKSAARDVAGAAAKLGAAAASIQSAASSVEQAADLKAVRTAFGVIGGAVMKQAKASREALGDVKVAYCPMVLKHWLQKGEKIRNPFYGQSMSECGRLSGLP